MYGVFEDGQNVASGIAAAMDAEAYALVLTDAHPEFVYAVSETCPQHTDQAANACEDCDDAFALIVAGMGE